MGPAMPFNRSERFMDAHSKPNPEKKPYETPVLQRYGDLPKITGNVGSMTLTDSGSPPKTRTA